MHESLSVDLVPFAKQYIDLLSAVHVEHVAKRSLYEGQTLLHAIQKYKTEWLPDLDRMLRGEIVVYQPTLDVCWVWHLHKLNPQSYMHDCVESFGRVLDVPPGLSPFSFCNQEWHQTFAPSYDQAGITISSDLVSAAKQESTFFWKVRWAEGNDCEFLQRAEDLYLKMFDLNVTGIATCRPTYDIELIWHTHMAFPLAYDTDVNRLTAKQAHRHAGLSAQTQQPAQESMLPGMCSQEVQREYAEIMHVQTSVADAPALLSPSPSEPRESSITRAELEAAARRGSDTASVQEEIVAVQEEIVAHPPFEENATSMDDVPLIASKQNEDKNEDATVAKSKCSFLSCLLPKRRKAFGAHKPRAPTPPRVRGELVKGG